jgi:nicotinate phosphoribosyltransferase
MADSPTLLTDRYQLSMLAAYARTGHAGRRAVFELFVRRLPPSRRYMVACGIGRAVDLLRRVRFSSEELAYLEADAQLGPAMRDPAVRELFEGFRFRGKVLAIPEGRMCFPFEPLVRVEGTLAEAQLVETLLLSIVNHDTRIASKCARIVAESGGRACFEFGARRTHERAAVDAARAAYVAGFVGTSNEEAAFRYGVPVLGTMAHSFILAHAADAGESGEVVAFRDFAATFQGSTVCLVDTFDTPHGVDLAIEAVGAGLSGVRLDSGDLLALSRDARARLDAAGLTGSKVIASNDLDEYQIADLLSDGAPIDAFGVGTNAVSTPDHGSLGAVYKLVAMEDAAGKMVAVQKRAGGKGSTAAPKQVYRRAGAIDHLIDLDGEPPAGAGEPLLVTVFEAGSPVGEHGLAAARQRLLDDLALAPAALRSIAPRRDDEGFPSRRSERLWALHKRVEVEGRVVLLPRAPRAAPGGALSPMYILEETIHANRAHQRRYAA